MISSIPRRVTFDNGTTAPGGSTRHIEFAVYDGSLTSDPAGKDVDVTEVNSAPVVTPSAGSGSYTEGSLPTRVDSAIDVVDADSSDLVGATVQITGNYQSGEDGMTFANTANITGTWHAGSGTMTLSGTDTVANYKAALRNVKFFDSSDTPSTSTRTVTFQVDDGSSVDNLSDPKTRDMSVTATNDKPVVTASGAATPTYTEDGAAVTVDGGITVSDVDSPMLAKVTVAISSNFTAGDTLGFAASSPISGSYDPGTGILTLSGAGTPAQYATVLQSITFGSSSQNPGSATRTISYVADDGAGFANTSDPATRQVNVVDVNDAPSLTQPDGALTYTEDNPTSKHSDAIASNLTASDADDANLTGATIQITAGGHSGEDKLHFTNANNIIVSGEGTSSLTLSGTDTVAHYRDALRSVSYQNTSDDPSSDTRTVSFTTDDGHAADHASNTVTRDISLVPTDDAPTAADQTFNGADGAVRNTTFVARASGHTAPATPTPTDGGTGDRPHKTVTGSVLTGATDPDGPLALVADTSPITTADGGSVTMQSNGDFVYEPKPGCTDTSDSFQYTVSDQGGGTDTGTATIALTGCVWYADNHAMGANDGTSAKPFDTVAQTETASGSGDSIFVFKGDGTTTGYTTGIDLKANQKLIGEAAALTIGSDTLHSADSANRPTITDTTANVVNLAAGNTLQGLQIEPAGGGGISGGAGDASGTIDDVKVIDTGIPGVAPGLDLNGTSGTYTISSLTVDTSGATTPTSADIGVRLNNAGTVNFASTGTISLKTNGAKALDATGTNMGTGSVFDDITVTGSGSGAVSMTTTTGVTTFGHGSGTNLDLTTVSGATPAFLLNNAGGISVPAGGTADVHATGGPAVDVTLTDGPTLSFDAVDSSNSANDGINLDSLGIGTFSATSGTLSGYSGIGFDLNGGNGAITYPGTFSNGGGATAEITNRTGGAVGFAGAINDTNDAGGGITMSGNTAGSTTFSNGTKTISTGAGNAISVSFPDTSTATAVFSGGGLNIDTTSGTGLGVSGVGGTADGGVEVSGSGNTIDTTTGTALNVTNAGIADSDLTFQGIASNQAADGIVLNNTANTLGKLVVTGNGGTCSSAATCTGGAIQSSTGAGISLNSVPGGVSLTRVSVNNGATDGIVGASVAGFALDNSWVANNGDVAGENGVQMTQLSGTVSFNTTTVTASADNNVSVVNTSGIVAATFSGGTYSNTNNFPTSGADSILLRNDGTGAMTATVQNATFTNDRDDHVQATAGTSATGTLNVTVTGNTMTDTVGQQGNGITINPGGTSSSTTEATLTNNNIQGSNQAGITVDGPGSSALPQPSNIDATITGNTIGSAAVSRSGSFAGTGITVNSNGGADIDTLISNNTIRQYSNPEGLTLVQNDGVGSLNATVRGNVIGSQAGTVDNLYGIRAIYGSIATDNGDGCLDLGGAGAFRNDLTGSSPAGSSDIRLRQAGPTKLTLPGYGGIAHDTTAVASYLTARNTAPQAASVSQPDAGATYVNAASCPLP